MADLVTAWSYSRYADYERCPLKFKLKVIDKLQEPGNAAMARGNAIHGVAEKYVARGPKGSGTLPGELASVKNEANYLRTNDAIVEQAWGFQRSWEWTGRQGWFGADVWFRAKADAVVLYDDDTALLIDWKTGKKYLGNEDQVRLFSLAAKKRYPNLKEVDTRLWYIDAPEDDNEIQFIYYEKDFAAIQKDWERKIRPMFADRKFAPQPNRFCSTCHFRKDNGGPCKF